MTTTVTDMHKARSVARLRRIHQTLESQARALPPCKSTEARLERISQMIDELSTDYAESQVVAP